MISKFVVTTRKEVVESLKAEGYIVIGVDGTVPGAFNLYDFLFDHHREGGADVQLQELPLFNFAGHDQEIVIEGKVAFVTTMVDADAICAAYALSVAIEGQTLTSGEYSFLEAVSYDCDHLAVPERLSHHAESAAMVVAALKQEGNKVAENLGLPTNRKEWTIEQKELYSSTCFEQGVQLIHQALNDKWAYKTVAKPYWEKVKQNTQMILEEKRILNSDVVIFDAKGLGGQYIDPRCWLIALETEGFKPEYPFTVTRREVFVNDEFKGYSYTLGTIPFHPRQNEFDLTQGFFEALTVKERAINPNADGWGGRRTVGGSGWNTPSVLEPMEVVNTVLEVVWGKSPVPVATAQTP